jgi:CubicO group peptidase (beta-lactamase class C family)
MQISNKIQEHFDDAIRTVGGSEMWGSVLVGYKGETLFTKGYGKCDYETKECDTSTLYEIASLSKQFTATAILHLHQNKKLNIYDSIGLFFKDIPKDKHSITLHHLLTHTAGLSKEIGVPYDSKINRVEYVQKMLQEQLASEPGKQVGYSNAGYAILAAVIEEITGDSFQNYLKQNLFTPSRMNDTGFIGDENLIKTGRASKRLTEDSGEHTAVEWHHYGWGYKGMGGVVTTVLDLALWDKALRGNIILNDEMKKILFEPFVKNHACGWLINPTSRDTNKAEHSGGVAGYGIHMVHFLDEDAVIVILSNDEMKARKVSQELENILFSQI